MLYFSTLFIIMCYAVLTHSHPCYHCSVHSLLACNISIHVYSIPPSMGSSSSSSLTHLLSSLSFAVTPVAIPYSNRGKQSTGGGLLFWNRYRNIALDVKYTVCNMKIQYVYIFFNLHVLWQHSHCGWLGCRNVPETFPAVFCVSTDVVEWC